MSQRIVLPWLNTNIPGAYVNTQVISNASGLATSGVVLIMGEAAQGPSYQITTLANNFFGPASINQVRAIYGSGPIVDAFQALCAASNDPDISGAPTSIYIIKTNEGAQASAIVPAHAAPYGTMTALNWGTAGNQTNFTITSLDAEVAPMVTGTDIPSLAALNAGGTSFTVRLNGGATNIVSLPAGTYTTGAQVAAALTGFPSDITASGAGTGAAATITLTVTADPAAYSEGWGKSFELVDSTPGDLAALGLVAALTVTSQEPGVEVQVINVPANVNESINVNPIIALSIGYEGTTAMMTINASTLTTTVTGGTGTSLSIPLSQYTTVGQLAAFINSQAGYSCSAAPAMNTQPPSALDEVTAIGICSTAASDQPGRVKNSVSAFDTVVNTSVAVSFTQTATQGLPDPGALTYLANGALGATLASDIVAAITQMASIQVNIIVPLFSQNASIDIAAGNTDPASTYTISAINELLKTHCLQYSTPTLKRNRMAVCSINDTYANCKVQAQQLSTYRITVTFQQVTQINSAGVSNLFLPWYGACLAAGMQTAGFYKSICNHLTNAISFQDPVGYSSGDPDDVSDALTAGLEPLALIPAANGGAVSPGWISDQTSYGLDTNFVYNSIQAVYLSDILNLDLGSYLQASIVGKSVADLSAGAILSSLQQRFDYYKKLKMTTTSSDAPLGYKNASVQLVAPSVAVSLEAKLTTSIYFVGVQLALSAVQQSASG